jgi:hypothetical protein
MPYVRHADADPGARSAPGRIVRGLAYTTGTMILTVTGAGCGADRAPRVAAEPGLTAAVLSEQDMPADYLPAESTAVFRGVRPAGRACGKLLALGDVRDPGAAPHAAAAFYQVDPGGAMVEHLLQIAPGRAHEYITAARRAAARCRRLTVRTKGHTMRLRQRPTGTRQVGEESYHVRYAGRVGGRHRFHLDMLLARVADRLLIMANVALLPAGADRDLVSQLADRAIGKLERGRPGAVDKLIRRE